MVGLDGARPGRGLSSIGLYAGLTPDLTFATWIPREAGETRHVSSPGATGLTINGRAVAATCPCR